METLKFSQQCKFDLKNEFSGGFDIVSNSFKNAFIVFSPKAGATVFELMQCINMINTMPYAQSYVKSSKTSRLLEVTNDLLLKKIYENCDAVETQEIALDQVYVGESYSDEEIKEARFVYADFAPRKFKNKDVLATLTCHGACQLWTKNTVTRQWIEIFNLTNNIFAEPSTELLKNIGTFQEVKKCIYSFWITAFSWVTVQDAKMLCTGDAAGCIKVFTLNDNFADINEYCQLQTNLKRIQSIKSFSNFLLVGGTNGQVELFKVEYGTSFCIKQVEILWSKADRIALHVAEITFSQESDSYFVLIGKSAFIIVFRLSKLGKLIHKLILPIQGAAKITGIDALTETSFIIATMGNIIKKLEVICTGDYFQITQTNVDIDFDTVNLHIVGVTPSRNRALWCFFLRRNAEILPELVQNNQVTNAAFVWVCDFNGTPNRLTACNYIIDSMDFYKDFLIGLELDIVKSFEITKVDHFNTALYEEFKYGLNEQLLQKFQIDLIVAITKLNAYKYKFKVSASAIAEVKFLSICVQIIYIFCRIAFLQNIYGEYNTLNGFQKAALKCMWNQLPVLITELRALKPEHDALNNIIVVITELVLGILATHDLSLLNIDGVEECLECAKVVNTQTMICQGGHKVRRCCVSYMQVDLFNNQFCPCCKAMALADETLLRQLFPEGEILKCTFCRFKFRKVDLFLSEIKSERS